MAIEEGGVFQTEEPPEGVSPPPIADEDAPEGLILGADSEWKPVLSVVMPTLNEEAAIAPCIQQVKSAVAELGVTAEILIADSSTDRTPEIARAMGAIVVEVDEEGYGTAYQHAFERVRGKYVVMGDADCTYDFEAIPRLLEPVVEGEADIAMGNRLGGDIEPGAMPRLHRYVGNPLLTRFLNSFYDAGVSDAHSGFRVVSRGALEEMDLQSSGMEFASEMVMDASARGLGIEEVPITYHSRIGDEKLDSFHDGWRHVKFMLLNAPSYVFSVPSLVFMGLGLLTLVVSLFDVQIAGITFSIHTAIAGSLMTIVGYQVGSLAVFSSLAVDTIRKPRDPVTTWITENLRLEHGTTVGLGLFAIGSAYGAGTVVQWIQSGFSQLPHIVPNLLAMTVIVIGVQTVFYAFFLSMLANHGN